MTICSAIIPENGLITIAVRHPLPGIRAMESRASRATGLLDADFRDAAHVFSLPYDHAHLAF